jgi:hypothetical protein
VPVDSTITRATFSLGGSINNASLVLTRPNGSVVQPTDPDVTVLSMAGGFLFTDLGFQAVGGGLVYSIAAPAAGTWTVAVNGTGDFSLKVSGETGLDLSSFRFVQLGGRPGHQGFFPIPGLPLAGAAATADAVVSGPFATTHFELRSRAGGVLQTLSLSPVPETTDEFSGSVTPPSSSFLVYLTGQDAAGTAYQRVQPASVRPQTVAVLAPPAGDLPAGQTTSYTFTVSNRGAASDTFSIVASDDRHFLTSVSTTLLTLGAGASGDVRVDLRPPAGAAPGVSDTLTFTAQSTSSPDTRNFAVITSVVGIANLPPSCDAAAPSVRTLWPPNHKMSEVAVLGVTDPDNDPVAIAIDGVTQDEPVNGLGDGDTSPDATGVGGATAMLRAERAGSGNGRVYSIAFTASDGRGGACHAVVTVCVPHNAGGSCVDDGTAFNSATPR